MFLSQKLLKLSQKYENTRVFEFLGGCHGNAPKTRVVLNIFLANKRILKIEIFIYQKNYVYKVPSVGAGSCPLAHGLVIYYMSGIYVSELLRYVTHSLECHTYDRLAHNLHIGSRVFHM